MGKPGLFAVLFFALMLAVSGCGHVSGPCDDSDPAGICANSHGQPCVC
ncbi:MAG TPA: hypothetical protein VFC56_16185 [Stellaceae bacterium]|nr:hypothetical protein [Stellaceae bacterium]